MIGRPEIGITDRCLNHFHSLVVLRTSQMQHEFELLRPPQVGEVQEDNIPNDEDNYPPLYIREDEDTGSNPNIETIEPIDITNEI
jgi:hypothetical protein